VVDSGSNKFVFGAWRSLVARTLGVREVAGSNPAAPTILSLNFINDFAWVNFTLSGAVPALAIFTQLDIIDGRGLEEPSVR
jgi:hypothetical protein